MKTLVFVLRKVFKFIFLFWVVISSLFGTYMIADKFFGRTVVSWALIRDFSSASLDLEDFSISARLRATTIGRVWRDEREPEPDFSDDNSTGAPYELSIKFDHVSAPGIVLKNIKLEQVQSGRVVFEKDELEAPIEVGEYSGIASASVTIPGIDSIHVRHKLSTEICVPDGSCTSFVHYFSPRKSAQVTAVLRAF